MDGTLFDSEDLTHDIFSKIASGFGKRLTEKDHSHVLGSAEPFWSSYFVEKWKLSIDPKEFAKLYWSSRKERIEKETQLNPGVDNLLVSLRKSGYAIGLVSSTRKQYLTKQLSFFKISKYFDFIVSGSDVKVGKPNPEPYLKAIKKSRYPAHVCISVEDSCNGVISAKKAGCKTIVLLNKHAKYQDCTIADIRIHELKDIEYLVR